MASVLKTIYEDKQVLVAHRKELMPMQRLEERIEQGDLPRPFAGKITRLVKNKKTALIAEIKKTSPSAGTIRDDFDPQTLAQAYHKGGAACISVLTDINHFQGKDEFVQQVRQSVPLAVLRKDFMIDPYQIYESRAIGADAVLLIMAILTRNGARQMAQIAQKLGMAVLVEVHNQEELKQALDLETPLIGINNRNLKNMEVSLETTRLLAKKIPRDRTVICESGIKTREDVQWVKKKAKTHAFLVGESLMRQRDVETATRKLLAV